MCSILTEPAHGASLLNRRTSMGYRQLSARRPPTGGMILSNTGPTEKSPKCPDWLEKELLRREPRRHSLALGDTAKLSMRQRHRGDLANKLYELKVKVKACHSIWHLAAFLSSCVPSISNGSLPWHLLSIANLCKLNVIMTDQGVGQLDRGTSQTQKPHCI